MARYILSKKNGSFYKVETPEVQNPRMDFLNLSNSISPDIKKAPRMARYFLCNYSRSFYCVETPESENPRRDFHSQGICIISRGLDPLAGPTIPRSSISSTRRAALL